VIFVVLWHFDDASGKLDTVMIGREQGSYPVTAMAVASILSLIGDYS